MVRYIQEGWRGTGMDAPWYLTRQIGCPRCFAQFILEQSDFMGVALDRQMCWYQLDSTFTRTGNANAFDPDAIQGHCPFCYYYPILSVGPNFGTTHTTGDIINPQQSSIQTYVSLGAVKATCVRFTDWSKSPSLQYGIFAIYLTLDNTMYQFDPNTNIALSIEHYVQSPLYPYAHGSDFFPNRNIDITQPHVFMSIQDVTMYDPDMIRVLQVNNMTLVDQSLPFI
jgi:hypothetical protein